MKVVEVKDLVKNYGDFEAVKGIDLSIEEGEIFGILGPNGAGKTTTVEILAGLRSRDRGVVKIFGIDPEIDSGKIRDFLGLQPQKFDFIENVTVKEVLNLFSSFFQLLV